MITMVCYHLPLLLLLLFAVGDWPTGQLHARLKESPAGESRGRNQSSNRNN